MAHEQWEKNAIERFISWLAKNGEGDWQISDEEVIVDERNRNFDYELSRNGNPPMAVELFRLIESEEELAAGRFWSEIANQIAAELRKREIRGFTIESPRFRAPKKQIKEFVLRQADVIQEAIQQNPGADEITAGGFSIQRIEGFGDVSLFWIGGGGLINPPHTATFQLQQLLPRKNEQLAIGGHHRVLFIVNWARIVGSADMLEACSLLDFSGFKNIDRIYFESAENFTDLVFDRSVSTSLAAVPPSGEVPPLSPLLLNTLRNRLTQKQDLAFRIAKSITDTLGTAQWLPPISRSELVSYGEDFVARGDFENALWIVNVLKDDPDPEIQDNEDDAHHKIARGEDVIFIYSVRGRLCWLIYKIICADYRDFYPDAVEILERFGTQENLYVRVHTAIALQGLAVRRIAKDADGNRHMADELANRVTDLAFRMLRENKQYPAILEALSQVFAAIRAIHVNQAHEVLDTLMRIAESDSVDNLAFLLLYFALFREYHNPEIGKFDGEPFKALLVKQIESGSPRLRARLANQFVLRLTHKEVSPDVAAQYLQTGLQGEYNHVFNLHLYHATSIIADTHPRMAFNLVRDALRKEVEALRANQKNEIWHGREYQQTVEKIRNSEHADMLAEVPDIIKGYAERFHHY